MAPPEMGVNNQEKNSPRSSAVKNLALMVGWMPASPGAASEPNYCGSNGGGSADSTHSGKDVAPMKTQT